VEVVFHQASAVGVGQSMYEIARYVEVNTQGTALLLDILANEGHNVRKLVVASSMSIYGEGACKCSACGPVYPKLRSVGQLRARDWEMRCPRCGRPVEPIATSENKPLYPTSIYAISKRDQEEMCLTVGRAYGIPTVALRYFNVYGPRQALSNPYTGVIAIFASRLLNNNPPLIFEDGLQSRDFIHVDDVVRANMLVAKCDEANYQVINIGTGQPTTVLEVAQALGEALGYEEEPEIINQFREGDIRHCYADTTRAKTMLGFEAKIAFDDGIVGMVNWLREQEAVDRVNVARQELTERGLVI
jgi:dTDP-L-rhamnose 4-epimerase